MQFLEELENLLAERKKNQPENSYTAALFRDGQDRILKKIVEEAGETVIAAKNKDRREIIHETADLLFHTLVMLVNEGVALEEIVAELETRHR